MDHLAERLSTGPVQWWPDGPGGGLQIGVTEIRKGCGWVNVARLACRGFKEAGGSGNFTWALRHTPSRLAGSQSASSFAESLLPRRKICVLDIQHHVGGHGMKH